MVKNNKIILIAFVFILLFSVISIEAKRAAPPVVQPVDYNGIEYRTGEMGYVGAYNLSTGEKIWEKKIYKVTYNPLLESDVQDVYISSLSMENEKLIVINEKGERYEVIPQNGVVSQSVTSSKDNMRILIAIAIAVIIIISIFVYLFLKKKRK